MKELTVRDLMSKRELDLRIDDLSYHINRHEASLIDLKLLRRALREKLEEKEMS